MVWGKCRACEAKDKEIEHLLALLEKANASQEKANARLAEIQSPGVNGRLEPRPTRPIERSRKPMVVPLPGYAAEAMQGLVMQGLEVEP